MNPERRYETVDTAACGVCKKDCFGFHCKDCQVTVCIDCDCPCEVVPS